MGGQRRPYAKICYTPSPSQKDADSDSEPGFVYNIEDFRRGVYH